MRYQDYKHIIPLQIRFCDIDKLDHVNNSVYHNYIELGRVTYFKEILKDKVNWNESGFILARTEIDHLVQVHLNDDIYCCTKVIAFGNKSITFKNAIVKREGEGFIPCAEVRGILVAMDYVHNVSIPVPAVWRELMHDFESAQ
jgi:acyl-CoA thioester hydrolase